MDGSRGIGAVAPLAYREEGCHSALVKTVTYHGHHLLIVRMAKLICESYVS
jgi:hypothetical protein